jgi:hypothetical protein
MKSTVMCHDGLKSQPLVVVMIYMRGKGSLASGVISPLPPARLTMSLGIVFALMFLPPMCLKSSAKFVQLIAL